MTFYSGCLFLNPAHVRQARTRVQSGGKIAEPVRRADRIHLHSAIERIGVDTLREILMQATLHFMWKVPEAEKRYAPVCNQGW